MSSDRPAALESLIIASTAVFGGALAVAIAPSLQRRASPADLPGALQAEGLSASGPLWQLAAFLVLVFGFALLGARVAPRIRDTRWAAIAYSVALLSALVPVMYFGHLRHVVLHGIVAAIIVGLARRLDPRFTRDDVVLIPILLSLYFAFLDIGFGRTVAATFVRAAIAVFVMRCIVARISTSSRPALAFALAPLALLLQLQWLPRQTAAVLAIVWIVATAIAGAVVKRDGSKLLAYAVYPIALSAYPLALLGVNHVQHVNFFEAGHNLLPASEMLRGELAYADVIPMHGFLSDGALDYLALRLGDGSIGIVLGVRSLIACLSVAAMYALALAATGSAPAACLAILISYMLFPWATVFIRPIPALLALASCVAAVRLRSPSWLIPAGAATALAFLTSLDFALYSAVIAIAVGVRSSDRKRMAGAFAAGFACVLVPAIVGFMVFGVAGDFVRVSVDLLRHGSVYIMGRFEIPDCLRTPTELAMHLTDPHCLSALLWILAAVMSAVRFARFPLRQRRGDAVWVIALWIVLAGASWVERRHTYYEFAIPAFLIGMLIILARKSRPAFIVVALAIGLLVRPFEHLFNVATPLRRTGGVTPAAGWVNSVIPRARGALFPSATASGIDSARRYVQTTLRSNETFFDFSNSGLLYYLLDRDCPVAHTEIGSYQTDAAQQEVVAALDRNRGIRAVLISFPGGLTDIDDVPNRVRAPLVWRYIEQNFEPAFAENGVVFWRRRP